jgi:hypothetical protein
MPIANQLKAGAHIYWLLVVTALTSWATARVEVTLSRILRSSNLVATCRTTRLQSQSIRYHVPSEEDPQVSTTESHYAKWHVWHMKQRWPAKKSKEEASFLAVGPVQHDVSIFA